MPWIDKSKSALKLYRNHFHFPKLTFIVADWTGAWVPWIPHFRECLGAALSKVLALLSPSLDCPPLFLASISPVLGLTLAYLHLEIKVLSLLTKAPGVTPWAGKPVPSTAAACLLSPENWILKALCKSCLVNPHNHGEWRSLLISLFHSLSEKIQKPKVQGFPRITGQFSPPGSRGWGEARAQPSATGLWVPLPYLSLCSWIPGCAGACPWRVGKGLEETLFPVIAQGTSWSLVNKHLPSVFQVPGLRISAGDIKGEQTDMFFPHLCSIKCLSEFWLFIFSWIPVLQFALQSWWGHPTFVFS